MARGPPLEKMLVRCGRGAADAASYDWDVDISLNVVAYSVQVFGFGVEEN